MFLQGSPGAAGLSYVAQFLQGLSKGSEQKRANEQQRLNAQASLAAQEMQVAYARLKADPSNQKLVDAASAANDEFDKTTNQLKKFYGPHKGMWSQMVQGLGSVLRGGRKPQAAPPQTAPPPPAPVGTAQQAPSPYQKMAEAQAKEYGLERDVRMAGLGAQRISQEATAQREAARGALSQAIQSFATDRNLQKAEQAIRANASTVSPNDPSATERALMSLYYYAEQTGVITKAEADTKIRDLGEVIRGAAGYEPAPQQRYASGSLAKTAAAAGVFKPMSEWTPEDQQKVQQQQVKEGAEQQRLVNARITEYNQRTANLKDAASKKKADPWGYAVQQVRMAATATKTFYTRPDQVKDLMNAKAYQLLQGLVNEGLITAAQLGDKTAGEGWYDFLLRKATGSRLPASSPPPPPAGATARGEAPNTSSRIASPANQLVPGP